MRRELGPTIGSIERGRDREDIEYERSKYMEGSTFGQHLFEQANLLNAAAAQHIAIGREQGEREAAAAAAAAKAALRTILAAWDENDVLPTRLLAALVNARKVAA